MSLDSSETGYQIYFLDVILIVNYRCRHRRPTRHISFPGFFLPANLTDCIWSIVDKKWARAQSIILASSPPSIITPHIISSSHYHDIYGLDIPYYFIYIALLIPRYASHAFFAVEVYNLIFSCGSTCFPNIQFTLIYCLYTLLIIYTGMPTSLDTIYLVIVQVYY